MEGHFCSLPHKAVNYKTHNNEVHYYQQDGKNANAQDFSPPSESKNYLLHSN
jgi:hypothetical protein